MVSYSTDPSPGSVRFLVLSLYQHHNWQSRKSQVHLCSKREENVGTDLCWRIYTKRQKLSDFTSYVSVSGETEVSAFFIIDTVLSDWFSKGKLRRRGQADLIFMKHL